MKTKGTGTALIGTGNAAWHFAAALAGSPFPVTQVLGSSYGKAAAFAADFDGIKPVSELGDVNAAVYILAVPDDKIEECAGLIKEKEGLVLHVSGTTPATVLAQFKHSGVVWPMASLSKGIPVADRTFLTAVTPNSEDCGGLLAQIGLCLSDNVQQVTDEGRAKLHLAAVLGLNFTNYMVTLAEDLCREAGVGREAILNPLMQLVQKLGGTVAEEAQTGPARRGDEKTLALHLQLLQGRAGNTAQLYRVLSDAIAMRYGHKILLK